jgi:hypothetical protein
MVGARNASITCHIGRYSAWGRAGIVKLKGENMKFAETMLLNAKFHGLLAYKRIDANDNRCALGLVEQQTPSAYMMSNCAESMFPWLWNSCNQPCDCMCDRHTSLIQGAPTKVVQIIAHVFNEHVMKNHGGGINCPEAAQWTIEQLADWINSVDPTPVEIPTETPAELIELALAR